MKTFVLPVVLLLSNLFFASAAKYDCDVSATFQTYDDPNDPLIPTKSDRTWAVGRVQTSYNAVHDKDNDDFTMSSASFDSYSYKKARLGDEEEEKETEAVEEVQQTGGLRGLRRALQELKAGLEYKFIYYFHDLRAIVDVFCTLCRDWDDDDSLAMTIDLEDELSATKVHSRWEAAWCDELQQGGRLALEYATNCKIEIYNCKLSSANPFADGGDEEVAHAVGDGADNIMAEAEKEIAAQKAEAN
mmetsp:Transcript_57946/g.168021  ORF Transcript_57946/g.168021 Transcript_57946/m.168021 type:complete len:245 (+) Transcript_57946:592-1326(+)|eukprot:CAMPEP_0176085486 /NCGR_PEP_ID=MMETSP0120_2-20121206/42784_1 /TAXON_ID=160619 /ORGANISM="Kryptoperidinium foliaceum, Strain CCMP 1326" /LENGTH=244 /DNA_ID=CAMNT_0017419301 /DNA_START=563 /DNA_END=1297 /DNA_ORIENTATION=+